MMNLPTPGMPHAGIVTPLPPPRIFVSHNHKDNGFGVRLVKDLRRAIGDDDAVWYDVSGGLKGGVNWWHEIMDEITARSVFIVVLSPDAVASSWVTSEIDIAWQQMHSRAGKRIIPILYRECDIRADLDILHIISFLPPKTYEESLKELLEAILSLRPGSIGASPLPFPRPPWQSAIFILTTFAAVGVAGIGNTLSLLLHAFGKLPPLLAHVTSSVTWIAGVLILLTLLWKSLRSTLGDLWRSGVRLRVAIISILALFILTTLPVATQPSVFWAPAVSPPIPTATPQGTAQPHSTVTPQGTAQPQNTTTPTVPELKLAWTYATKGHIEESSPVVANGMVYIGSLDHKLYALDAKSGAFRWSYTTAGPIRSSVAVYGGMVYVGSLDHNLYALDALSGAKKWSYSTGDGIYSSPMVANGILYFGSDDGKLYALDAQSGAKKWLYSTTAQIVSTPAVANGTVYFGSEDENLYALDAASGTMKWSKNTQNAITSSPKVSLADNLVYIGSWTAGLTAFDMGSGAKVWGHSIDGWITSSPTVANGVLYIGDTVSYVLYAIDSTSGAEQWHYPQFYSPPANGVTSQPSLPDAGITSSPAVANGVVYIGSADYNLYALDAKSGKELGSYATGGSILSSPVVANGMIYVGSSDNKLYAFHLPGT